MQLGRRKQLPGVHLINWINELQIQQENLLKNIMWGTLEWSYWRWSLVSTCVHVCTHLGAHPWGTCAYTPTFTKSCRSAGDIRELYAVPLPKANASIWYPYFSHLDCHLALTKALWEGVGAGDGGCGFLSCFMHWDTLLYWHFLDIW